MTRIIASVFLILLTGALVALFIFGVIDGDVSLMLRLPKIAAMVITCILAVIRLNTSQTKILSLKMIEKQYSAELKSAFADAPALRQKLLRAIRLYNTNRYEKAAKKLIALMPECRGADDHPAVGLFLALTFTDMQLYKGAIEIYEKLIEMNVATPTMYNNLGHIYITIGDNQSALSYLTVAVQNDPENEYAHNNLANLYFDVYNFEKAKTHALRALEINRTRTTASSLLAIIYSLEDNEEEAARYTHMAVAAGYDPDKLKRAIAHFRAAQMEKDEEESEEEEISEEEKIPEEE